jgi:hypothetical protein
MPQNLRPGFQTVYGLVVPSWLVACWILSSNIAYSPDYHHGEDITGGFCLGAGFPSCHKSIYRVSGDNFRGSACVSKWILISVEKKKMGLVFHNLNGCIRTINLSKSTNKFHACHRYTCYYKIVSYDTPITVSTPPFSL